MNFKKIGIFLFKYILIIILISCDKSKYTFFITDEFKNDCLFLQGSYWIYQNDSTGIVDCTYISGPSVYETFLYDNIAEYETVSILFNSAFLSSFYMKGGYCKKQSYSKEILKIYIHDNDTICTPWVGYLMYAQKGFEFTVDCYFNEYFNPQWRIHIKEIYPEYIVNQHFYKNIQFIRTVPTYQAILSGNDSLDVYYSKGKGIVRFIHYNVNGSGDTESWSLLRYRVVQ